MCTRAYWLLLVGAAAACELQEVTVVDFSDVVVGEVYVILGDDPTEHRVSAFLHGTAAGGTPDTETFDDALVRIAREDGFAFDLGPAAVGQCVDSLGDGATGSCFVDGGPASSLAPGEALDLTITLGDGRTLLGALRVPGDFQLDGVWNSFSRIKCSGPLYFRTHRYSFTRSNLEFYFLKFLYRKVEIVPRGTFVLRNK
jgi:hypothetical protein